jgi:mono/diheme cytochrome c family protein
MSRFLVFVLLTAITVMGAETTSPTVPSNQSTVTTFNKDVLPVLQKNCQVCHRSGGVAPMSFATYESTRPYAKAIKAAVINKKMPPWFADPHVGEFRNAPKLTQADIATLSAWADGGAAEGNPADKPAPVQWADGWRIQPDVVVSMAQPFRVPAKGAGEIRKFIIDIPFKEDTWVSAIEIRPGDASVVHHVILQVPELNQVDPAGFSGNALNLTGGVASVTVCADCGVDPGIVKGPWLVWSPASSPKSQCR